MLSIAQWLVLGNGHNIEPTRQAALGFAKDDINLFERTVGSFGVEEVYDGEDESVSVVNRQCLFDDYVKRWDLHHSEDNIGFVADGTEGYRSNHHNYK